MGKLIIGLGGTGREVLLRIRRKIFEQHGTLDVDAVDTAFRWIDTDPSGMQKEPRGLPKDYVTRRTAFRENEMTIATVDHNLAKTIRDHRDLYKPIWDWADESLMSTVLNNNLALTAGAMGIPPLGRFVAFARATQIRRDLKNSLANLNRNPLRIFVVGSLAGGTGAGMCLDVAAMLRAGTREGLFPEYPELDAASIWAYFVLPDAFLLDQAFTTAAKFDEKRARANGYAMLQEIERSAVDRSNKTKILERGNGIRASWLTNQDPSKAAAVPLPVYNSCFLFDGHSQDGGSSINKIEDMFELVANLLFQHIKDAANADGGVTTRFNSAETNANSMMIYGHFETVPPGRLVGVNDRDVARRIMNAPETSWGDLYSFHFGAAGMARITNEAERLRLLAAYRLVTSAIECWRGVEETLPDGQATFKPGMVGPSEQMRWAVERKLAEALGVVINQKVVENNGVTEIGRENPGRNRDDVLHPHKWTEVKLLTESAPRPKIDESKRRDTGNRTLKFWRDTAKSDFETLKSSLDAKTLKTQLCERWFGNGAQSLHPVARAIVESDPMTSGYAYQGGLEALGVLAGVREIAGMRDNDGTLRKLLGKMKSELESCAIMHESAARKLDTELNELQESLANAQQNLDGLISEAARLGRNAGEVGRAILVTPSTREHALQNHKAAQNAVHDEQRAIENLLKSAHQKLQGWVEQEYTCRVYRCLAGALGEILQEDRAASALGKRETAWCTAYHAGKHLVDRLCRGDDGLYKLMEHLAGVMPDKCSLHLGLAIQRSPSRLWRELSAALNDAMHRQIATLQHDILRDVYQQENPSWLALLDRDLDGMHADTQVDGMLGLALEQIDPANFLRKHRISQLLQRADILDLLREVDRLCGVQVNQPTPPQQWLLDVCKPKARLPEIPVRQIVGAAAHDHNTYRYLLASNPDAFAGRFGAFDRIQTGDDNHVVAIQLETAVPLPNFQVLADGARSAAEYNSPKLLHFFKPKSAYSPIHRMLPEDGDERMSRALHALLAVMLGQFREVDIAGGACLALYGSNQTHDNYVAYANLTSMGDLMYCLGPGYLENFLDHLGFGGRGDEQISKVEALARRNADIMEKLQLETLFILYAASTYNLKWIDEQHTRFCARDGASDDWQIGPQEMVLLRIQAYVEDCINRRYHLQRRDIIAQSHRLSQFLHHVTRFTPVSIGSEDTGYLLGLRAELGRFNKQRGDLLDHTRRALGRADTIRNSFSLIPPQDTYAERDGEDTLRIHRRLCGRPISEQVSMNPYVAAQVPEFIPDGFTDEEFIDPLIMRGEKPKAGMYDWSVLLPEHLRSLYKRPVAQDAAISNAQTAPASLQQPPPRQAPAVAPALVTPRYWVAGFEASELTLQEIAELLRQARINGDTEVCQQGWAGWCPLKNVDALKALMPGARVGPPPRTCRIDKPPVG